MFIIHLLTNNERTFRENEQLLLFLILELEQHNIWCVTVRKIFYFDPGTRVPIYFYFLFFSPPVFSIPLSFLVKYMIVENYRTNNKPRGAILCISATAHF